jgi:glycosyltransferase involved in cell wall biosynthesis
MKIVQVQTQAEAAGAQRVSDMVGEGLRARGHQVRTVFMYRKTSAYDADPHADFVINDTPRSILGQLRAAIGLFGYLRRQRPDVVLSFQHYGNVFGTLGGRLAGARVLIANQSGVPLAGGLRGLATLMDKAFGSIGLYRYSVVNSAWTERQYADYPQSYRRRIRRIDHGVPTAQQQYDCHMARRAFGLPEARPTIVSTGRLNVLKNHTVLVDALALLPGVSLAIAGAGPEREPLLARAAARGVSERLYLVGELAGDKLFEFLAAGDVFAFSSMQETFGLAVVEAAVAGLPVVAADIEVLREVLSMEDGIPAAATFVDPKDAGAWAAALGRVLAQQEGQAGDVLTAPAAARLAQRYAVERMCLAYEALITS